MYKTDRKQVSQEAWLNSLNWTWHAILNVAHGARHWKNNDMRCVKDFFF